MDANRFGALLEEQHSWPCHYTFKFIVAQNELEEVLGLFPAETPTLRPSTRSKFVGVTFQVNMATSTDVVDIYERAANIENLIAL